MRFMMIVKATKDSEAGVMPPNELISAMTKYNEQLINAGVMVDGAGLQASSKGARVRFNGSQRTVIDGPFAETKELVSGYWVIRVKSREEAIEWAKRTPFQEGELELRQFFEMEDFAPSDAIDEARALAKKMGKSE